MIDFYYWGIQCPYNFSNMKALEAVEEKYNVKVNYIEMSKHQDIVKELNIFSPTFTIFDKKLRWTGPITEELILSYLNGEMLHRTPYIVKSENRIVKGELKLLIPKLSSDIKKLCCSKTCKNSSAEKGMWLNQLMSDHDLKHMGVLHYVDSECVGGVEYVPTMAVPYDIPKSADSAFLTCVYASDPIYDYKSYPLEKLEEELKRDGYKKIYAIASQDVAFPNGPLEWFIKQGYSDLGVVYHEENDGADQHLIEKVI
ncbi:MAG: hypothetical protein JEZ08_04790 [Clostridiales bacterium]|nr:hypothetical protein [Clostridiales bacterium]